MRQISEEPKTKRRGDPLFAHRQKGRIEPTRKQRLTTAAKTREHVWHDQLQEPLLSVGFEAASAIVSDKILGQHVLRHALQCVESFLENIQLKQLV